MDHFKQTESFMDLFEFEQPILAGSHEDILGGNMLQRQFVDCAGGVCCSDVPPLELISFWICKSKSESALLEESV